MQCQVLTIFDDVIGDIENSGKIKTSDQDYLGFVTNNDGKIYDSNENLVGEVLSDGVILNKCGIKVGYIKDNGYVFDSSHRFAGRLNCSPDINRGGGALLLLLDQKLDACLLSTN